MIKETTKLQYLALCACTKFRFSFNKKMLIREVYKEFLQNKFAQNQRITSNCTSTFILRKSVGNNFKDLLIVILRMASIFLEKIFDFMREKLKIPTIALSHTTRQPHYTNKSKPEKWAREKKISVHHL